MGYVYGLRSGSWPRGRHCRRQGGAGGALQGDKQGLRHWQGRHRDGSEQGERGPGRDRRRLRRQAAVRHRHGCQGAEDHPLEGYLLWQGGLNSNGFEQVLTWAFVSPDMNLVGCMKMPALPDAVTNPVASELSRLREDSGWRSRVR